MAAAVSPSGFGGFSLKLSDNVVFPSELKYRSLMAERSFENDITFFPHEIAGFDAPLSDSFSATFATNHINGSDVCNNAFYSRSLANTTTSAWDGQWHHLAATFNSVTKTKSIYYDGALIHTAVCSSGMKLAGGGVMLGTTPDNNPPSWFDGELDEVRVWPMARTQDQIKSTMFRPLSPAEANQTTAYFNFDNWSPSAPFTIQDLSPNHLDINMGQSLAMDHNEIRLAPKLVQSTSPVLGSTVVVDAVRATATFPGVYTVSNLALKAGASSTLTISNLPDPSLGLQIAIGTATSAPLTSAQLPFSFSASSTLTITAKADTPATIYASGVATMLMNIQGTANTITLTVSVKAATPLLPGNSGSALYCNGAAFAYAKDFSFGAMTTSPSYTIEFWEFQFLNNPLQNPSTAFSIGNSEISHNTSSNWCLGVSSPGIPNSEYCRGRLEMDVPAPGGGIVMYSGWNPDNSDGYMSFDGSTIQSQWNHIAVTSDAKTVNFYVNGVLMNTFPDFGFVPNPTGQPLGLYMCAWPFWGAFEHNFKGFLDEFKIWNYPRTNAQIRSTMAVGLEGNEAGLVAYYKFDEYAERLSVNDTTPVTVTKDSSANKFDLVFGGCVPNKAPYCPSTNGSCITTNYPRVPCYTNTDEIMSTAMPSLYLSSAPVSGFSQSYTAHPGGSLVIPLSATTFDAGVTYQLVTVPDTANGILYASDGKTVLSAGSVTTGTTVIFKPAPGKGGNPLDSIKYGAINTYNPTPAGNTTVSLRVLCGVGEYLNVATLACQACPFGTYAYAPSLAPSCTAYDNLLFSNPLGTVLTIINGICAAVTVLITVFTFVNVNTKIIRAASPLFSAFVLVGCMLGHAVIFTFPLLPSATVCMIQPALATAAYNIIMMNVGIKTFRIHRIFNSSRRNTGDPLMKDGVLSSISLSVLGLDGILILIWFCLDAPKPVLSLNPLSGNYFYACTSSSQKIEMGFVGALVALKIIITGFTLALGMQVRKITASNFNESKYIVLCIYNISVIAIILIPLLFMGDSISYTIRGLFGGIIGSFLCCATAVILYGPKVLAILSGQGNDGNKSSLVNTANSANTANKQTASQQAIGLLATGGPRKGAGLSSQNSAAPGDGQVHCIEFTGVEMKAKGAMMWEARHLYFMPASMVLLCSKMNQTSSERFRITNPKPAVKAEGTGEVVPIELEGKVYLIKFGSADSASKLDAMLSAKAAGETGSNF
ncbi:hypothetical protein HK101_011980 [Irineochytrium annulatum]|nr:hypothetical protein HK101_011980 [Irineochytrium annulatum]